MIVFTATCVVITSISFKYSTPYTIQLSVNGQYKGYSINNKSQSKKYTLERYCYLRKIYYRAKKAILRI